MTGTSAGPAVGPAPGASAGPAVGRHVRELDRAEALGLLATVSLGRIVFTQHALPAVRPVTHVVDGEDVVIRIHEGGAPASLVAPGDVPGVVVAYEADAIDPDTHLGWSVVVTGYARRVADDGPAGRSADLVRPWTGRPPSAAVRIRPDLVTGFRLEAAPPPPAPAVPG
ncbi:pyridoxamine 5'-phosphate oxidase family protein [Streptomyces sp. WAC06614]|uniref:pyridoxamine 5'-phosphate oxidase family protein n=1 Tax=Streptomyces sp. WAC06614 TaxID=2487416 RepID=UPI000F7A51EF|nr:pyridoxamine 5'-phosphate oxidase family protein [Streptomyces sp. WAC06614]RSS78982.1 pyridoxamine 5'-phosphate oxidase family protein [Streptomyces sp. WAC06614]